MKRTTALAFLAATLISMCSALAHAQADEFKVPFNFIVGNQTLSADTYRVSYAYGNILLISNSDGSSSATISTFATYDRTPARGTLLFARYGNRYFLHKVLSRDLATNAEIPKSGIEKQVQIQDAQLSHSRTVAVLYVPAQR
jgi:hypothetical protein